MNFFVWGLKLEIRRELLLSKPLDLGEAMAKAQLFEDQNEDLSGRRRSDTVKKGWYTKPVTVSPTFSSNTSHSVAAYKPSQSITSVGTSPPPSVTSNPSLPIKKLSPAELKDRRDKGLCFTCDEKFSYGHKCKNRMLILCAQDEDECEPEMENKGDELEDASVEEVSLHSLSNSMNPRIFRIMASHGSETVEVLIDTGSNNNFIQETLMNQLKFPYEETKRFKVYMGNGHFLLCSKLCRGVELLLQGHRFVVDLYVLPICGLDVVLGMQWLQTLGPCIHDHKALTMEFVWEGSTIKLAGSTDVSAHQLSFTQLNALFRVGNVRDCFRLTSTITTTLQQFLYFMTLNNDLHLSVSH